MMKLQKSQKGVTMFSIAFYLGLLAFVVLTVLKLFPVYMENVTVASAVKNLESNREGYMGVLAVKQSLIKNFGINNVTMVPAEDIRVTRDNQTYMVDVNYEIRIPYIRNISLVISFENHAEVAAR
jgi:aspartate carbamoyltransferase regulatory subunit